MQQVEIYLEVGTRRVFAGALEWPGWCRSGRGEEDAIQRLLAYAGRYAEAIDGAAFRFAPSTDAQNLVVTERLDGNATTDFGAPGIPPAADARPLGDPELQRQQALLLACWSAFDQAAEAASSAVLRKGPRGGGRELAAIRRHVLEADAAYVRSLGGSLTKSAEAPGDPDAGRVRAAMIEAVAARARGDPLPKGRRSRSVWSARYGVRRSAWHALDHAWEIEDRAQPPED